MSKQKKIEWTPAKMKQYEEKTVVKSMVLVCACLMDEFDYTAEDIKKFSERFTRYNTAVAEHLLTVKMVAGIVEDVTGVKVGW